MWHQRWPAVAATLTAVSLATACTMVQAGEPDTALRVVLADDWATAPAVTDVIAEFERDHPGVSVVVQASQFSQIPELIGGAVDLREPHDLAHWHAFAAAASGLAQPLDDLWAEAGLAASEYLPGALAGVTWADQRFGVPLDTNALVLLVNESALATSGADGELDTIEGFRATADAVAASPDVDHVLSVSSSSWTTYGWIVAHGGSLMTLDADGQPTFTFEDPGTLDALRFLAGLVSEGKAPRPFAPDLAGDAVQAFTSGDIAMHASGSWDLPATWRTPATSVAPQDVSVRPLPQADPGRPRTVLGGSSLFVPVGSDNRELAFDLMLRLTADDVALRLVTEEGRLPARTRVLADERFPASPDLAAFVEQLEHAEVMRLIAFPDVAAAFREGVEDVLAERRSPAEAMSEVQRYADTWLQGARG